MLKSFLYFIARGAIGFFLISLVFVAAQEFGTLPQDDLQSGQSTTYTVFYLGTMIAWMTGLVAALLVFMKLLPERPSLVIGIAKIAPVIFPILYAAGSYVWLTQDKF